MSRLWRISWSCAAALLDVEAEAAAPVDPDDTIEDVPVVGGTVLARLVLPVLDAVLPDVVDVDDVTPPVERSCPRIARRDCNSATSADGVLLATSSPVVDEDVDDPVGLVFTMWVTPSEGPSVDDPEDGAGGDAATGSVVAMWVEPIDGPPVDDPEGGASGVPLMGGTEEDVLVEPLVPASAVTAPGVPFIWSCDSIARNPDEAALAAGSTAGVSDCASVSSNRSGMDGVEPLVAEAPFEWD